MGYGRLELTSFTPVSAAIGGLMIGLAAILLMATLGRISGISGIVRDAVVQKGGERAWRLAFLAGLVLAAAGVFFGMGIDFPIRRNVSTGFLIVAGLLVGLGTGVGSGCTSGHGICGAARFSRRSIAATLVFVGVGILTTWVMRHGMELLS